MSTSDLKQWIDRGVIQLNHDEWEPRAEIKHCPECHYLLRMWYVTAFNREGDFVDAFTSWKCLKCDYEVFNLECETDSLSEVKKQTPNI